MITRSPLAVVLTLMTVSVPRTVSRIKQRLFGKLTLFCNQWRDIGLKATDPHPHDHNSDGESCNGAIGVDYNGGDGRDNQNYVTDDGDETRDLDGLEATPVSISQICT